MIHKLSNGLERLFRWSHSPVESIGAAAFVIAVAGVASRLLGFVRDRLLASSFGAGDILDAYYAAFRIPDLIYGFLVLGALSAAFVPVFTELRTKGEYASAWRLAQGVLYLLLLSLGGLILLGIALAPWISGWLAPGFSSEKQALVTEMTRIMLLAPLLLGVSAVFGGVLVSMKQFVAYSLAPIFYNVGIIIGIVWLYPFIGSMGLAWGVVLGALLHLLAQFPSVYRSGFRFRVLERDTIRSSSVRQVIRLMIPRSLAMAVNQISLLIVTIFASLLASGSLAAFTLAMNIQSVPLGLFGIAFSLAAFPMFSLYAARAENQALFDTLAQTTARILYFVLPISVLMLVFRAEIVRVILGTGSFNWEDTILTFGVLGYLVLSLFAQCLIPLFVRAFFALQNTKTPLYTALLAEGVHLALIPLFLPRFGVEGLAMAFSLGVIVNFTLLYFFLRKKLKLWNDQQMLRPAIQMFGAALVAGIVAQYSKWVFALTIDRLDTFVEVFAKLSFGVVIGFTVYILISVWLKFPEFTHLVRYCRKKFFREPQTLATATDHPEKGDW